MGISNAVPDPVTEGMTEQALQILLAAPDGWRSVVRDLAAGWPAARPLELSYALVCAAQAIETNFDDDSPSRTASDKVLRLTALLSTDLYAMEVLEMPANCAADLRSYWTIHDPYFLQL